MENEKFDFEAFKKEAIDKLKAGKGLSGQDGAFTPLLKAFLEEAMKGELDVLGPAKAVADEILSIPDFTEPDDSLLAKEMDYIKKF